MADFMALLRTGSLIGQVARDLRVVTDLRFAAFGLTTQQAALLAYAASGETSPRALASAVGTDTAGATRLIDRLAAKGLLARRPHPGDRRSVVIDVTPAGLDLAPRLPAVFGEVSAGLLTGLSDDEIYQLSALLGRVAENLRDPTAGVRAASRPAVDVD